MAHVLSVQDLSCLGKCSLTVALPVLSAMGCTCTPLPTAILSSHTGFPNPHVLCLTEDLIPTLQQWQSVGARFDAVSIGYLADPRQAAVAEAVIDAFGGIAVIDPVMGDHGKRYSGLTPAHTLAMKQICHRGTVLLPNITEACLLTDTPYRKEADEAWYWTLLDNLRRFGTKAVVLTGVSLTPGQTGFIGFDETETFSYQAPMLPRQCHGTGDLFAAVVSGALAKRASVKDAATLAARFAEQVLQATPEASAFGAAFEPCLPWLWENT